MEGDGQGQAEEGQRAWPEISGDQIKCGQREEIQHGSGRRQEVLGMVVRGEKPGEVGQREEVMGEGCQRKSWTRVVRGRRSEGGSWREGGKNIQKEPLL